MDRASIIKTGSSVSGGALFFAVLLVFYFMIDSYTPIPSDPNIDTSNYITLEEGLKLSLRTVQILAPVFGIGILMVSFGLFLKK